MSEGKSPVAQQEVSHSPHCILAHFGVRVRKLSQQFFECEVSLVNDPPLLSKYKAVWVRNRAREKNRGINHMNQKRKNC